MEVDILDNKLKEANIENLNFRLFYSSLFPSPPPKYHEQFTDLLTDISGWPTVSFWHLRDHHFAQSLPQDETEYLLMTLILLFSPHSLAADEFRLVERFQLEYFTLLQKYLDKKCGEWLLCTLLNVYYLFVLQAQNWSGQINGQVPQQCGYSGEMYWNATHVLWNRCLKSMYLLSLIS